MRKLVAQEFLTLDGVMEAPEKWQLGNDLFGEDMGLYIDAAYRAADAFLFGRVTYQEFSGFWPTQPDSDPIAKKLNNATKYVVSSTLKTPEWKNTKVLRGDLAKEVDKLKSEAGQDILIIGSAQLVSGLTEHGLIDEYQLMVHPIVVGRGKHLFKDGIDPTLLKLRDTKTFDTGVIGLTYARSGKAKMG